MGAEEIVAKIKAEANAEREKILSEAEANVRKKVEEAKKEIEAHKKAFIAAEDRKGAEEKERIVRAARLNARKHRWDAEEAMIAKALEEAMRRIKGIKTDGFNGNSYSDVLTGLIKDAAVSILAGGSAGVDLDVLVSEEDSDFVTSAMLKKIADEIHKKQGVKVRLSLSGARIKTAGGVIVTGNEGKIEVNNTFERRIARFSTSLREDVAKALFTPS